MNISTLQTDLQEALTESAAASAAYEKAAATIGALKTTAEDKQNQVKALIVEFSKATGGTKTTKTYKLRSPEESATTTAKRKYTLAINDGLPPAKAEKIREQAYAKALANALAKIAVTPTAA